MEKIIFLAPYPTEKNLQDGFFVRVKNIDNIFASEKRLYLNVSITKNRKFRIETIDNNLTVVDANLFLHYNKIRKLLKRANIYYAQSLHNYLWTIFFPFSKKKKVIWDVHGAVPEETSFHGKRFKAYLSARIEAALARRVSLVVSVTNSMDKYLAKKYPKLTKNRIVFPIVNEHILKQEVNNEKVNLLRKEFDIAPENTVFMYSGGVTNKWQRFEDVLKVIKELKNPSYRFIILTGHLNEAKALIDKYGLTEKITVRKVQQDELPEYYSLAHYGFILRDAHPLNHVAAPTKLLEYLHYGLKPIVDYKEIGDFFDLGCEYVYFKDVSDNLTPVKSEKNTAIIEEIIKKDQKELFASLVLQE